MTPPRPTQGKLFETGTDGAGRNVYHAPSNWTEPSQDGAKTAQANVQRECRRVLDALGTCGPLTREELSVVLHHDQGPLCARLRSLELDRKIRKADYRRRSSKGIRCTVYELGD